MGAENVFEFQKDSSVFDPAYEEKFDGVLCDVPCSGFGTVSENPDIKLFRKEEDSLPEKGAGKHSFRLFPIREERRRVVLFHLFGVPGGKRRNSWTPF